MRIIPTEYENLDIDMVAISIVIGIFQSRITTKSQK
jgi:hypothetical protein